MPAKADGAVGGDAYRILSIVIHDVQLFRTGLVRDIGNAAPRDAFLSRVPGDDFVGKGVDHASEGFFVAKIFLARDTQPRGGVVQLA